MTKINHIGIVVDDLHKYIDMFDKLGGDVMYIEDAKDFGAKCVFIKFDNILIELVKGKVPGNHLNKFVEKYGSGLHHIAVLDNNIEGEQLKKGALPGMKVEFNIPSDENRILIEKVRFKK